MASPMPGLILLDLKLPRKNGMEVLAWIRAHPQLRFLPVIVFSSSDQERDLKEALSLGANAYVVKPQRGEERRELAAAIKTFWLGFHRHPPDNKCG